MNEYIDPLILLIVLLGAPMIWGLIMGNKKKYYLIHKENYELWLDGYIKKGGKITHYYDYDFIGEAMILTNKGIKSEISPHIITTDKPIMISAKYGADSEHILFVNGVKDIFIPKNIGHNNYYFMDDFTQIGGFVPCYKDMKQFNDIG